MKKGEGTRKIIGEIQDGYDTSEKIRQHLGWDRRTFWYHKRRAIKLGLIEENEDGRLRVVLEPGEIADPKKIADILDKIRSSNRHVRREGLKDLQELSQRRVITDPSVYEFLVGAIVDSSYGDFATELIQILNNSLGKVEGTKHQINVYERFKKNEDRLRQVALQWETINPSLLHFVLKALRETSEGDFLEVVFEIIIKAEKRAILWRDESIGASGGPVGNVISGELIYLSKETLEGVRERLYKMLEEYEDNSDIVEKIEMFLRWIRGLVFN
jgi:hypothetical protein